MTQQNHNCCVNFGKDRKILKHFIYERSDGGDRAGDNLYPSPIYLNRWKKHAVNCASMEGVFRIVQSIPSKKAEPFKRWLAQIGAERIQQMQDPELGIQQSLMDYKRLGYSDNWINQRLKSIEIRKDLTDFSGWHMLSEQVNSLNM